MSFDQVCATCADPDCYGCRQPTASRPLPPGDRHQQTVAARPPIVMCCDRYDAAVNAAIDAAEQRVHDEWKQRVEALRHDLLNDNYFEVALGGAHYVADRLRALADPEGPT